MDSPLPADYATRPPSSSCLFTQAYLTPTSSSSEASNSPRWLGYTAEDFEARVTNGRIRPRIEVMIPGLYEGDTDDHSANSPPPVLPPYMPGSDPVFETLRDKFPTIRGSYIRQIKAHIFEAHNIYQLDSDFNRRDGLTLFDRFGRGQCVQGERFRDYSSLNALLDPLFTYFRILVASVGAADATEGLALADATLAYVARLIQFAEKYEWNAVLAYHFDFHRMRLREMRHGEYGGWAGLGEELRARHLVGRELPRLDTKPRYGVKLAGTSDPMAASVGSGSSLPSSADVIEKYRTQKDQREGEHRLGFDG